MFGRDPRTQIVMYDEMMKAGIMPWDGKAPDMNKVFSHLPEDEARAMKRKFRKIWRKLMKKEQARWKQPESKVVTVEQKRWADEQETRVANQYGAGNPSPSRSQRIKRRVIVQQEFERAAREQIKTVDGVPKR